MIYSGLSGIPRQPVNPTVKSIMPMTNKKAFFI